MARSAGGGLLALPFEPLEAADGSEEQGSRGLLSSHTAAGLQLCCLRVRAAAQPARCSRVPRCLPLPGHATHFLQGRLSKGEPRGAVTPRSGMGSSCSRLQTGLGSAF